jgi:hypothetical protein
MHWAKDLLARLSIENVQPHKNGDDMVKSILGSKFFSICGLGRRKYMGVVLVVIDGRLYFDGLWTLPDDTNRGPQGDNRLNSLVFGVSEKLFASLFPRDFSRLDARPLRVSAVYLVWFLAD